MRLAEAEANMDVAQAANPRRRQRLSPETFQKALLAAQTRMREDYLSGKLETELQAARLKAQQDGDGDELV